MILRGVHGPDGTVTYADHVSRPLWRRLAAPLAAFLVVVVVATGVVAVSLTRRAFPQTSGELAVAGLEGEVEVIRDARGIPHIYADTATDLFRAQGFVAAQERFFQMDLRRHIVSGRLSELVGEAGLETDKVIRTLGWRRVAEQELALLTPETRTYLQAYAAGVNAYLEQRDGGSTLGLEYVVLAQSAPGYQVQPWDEVDSLAWLKAMAWDLRGNYADELARGRLAGQVSLQQLDSLYPDYPAEQHPPILGSDEWAPGTPAGEGEGRGGTRSTDEPPAPAPLPTTGDPAGAVRSTVLALGAVPELVGRGEGIGSNSWVVSGEHTSTGMPLLANDPHLALSQPSVWMQTGLHCREVGPQCPFDVSGFTFAGLPGVVIGHNQRIAWGFTNLDPDVTDFYLEDTEGDSVRRGERYEPMTVRTETIKVAGGEDVQLKVRETSHGPIVSGVLDSTGAMGRHAPIDGVRTSRSLEVSLAWTGLHPATTADAIFALDAATGWEDFRAAASAFAVPSQNLLYADVEGNIGYQAPGLVPIRQSATHGQPPGFSPAPGWDPTFDWDGWVAFEDLPHVLNPEDGMIVAANQAVTSSPRPFLTTESDKGYRSARIEELLREHLAEGPLTVDDMREIQLDDTSSFALAVVPYLLDVELDGSFYTEAQDLLRDWDGSAPAKGEQSAAAAYFYSTYAHLLEAVFDDELPPDLGVSGNSRSMLVLEGLLSDPESVWWDDARTPGAVESRDEVIRSALVQARHELTRSISKDPADWSWGGLHRVTMKHQALGGDGVPDLVRSMVNGRTIAVPGGSAQVNAMNWDASKGSFDVTSGPSMRMVVDLADLDASTWVNHTGTSGHPFSPTYRDQTGPWARGETFPWPFSREAVEAAGEQTLRLVPGDERG